MEKVIPDIVKRINLHYRRISVSEHERGSGRRKKADIRRDKAGATGQGQSKAYVWRHCAVVFHKTQTVTTRELKDARREIKRLVDSVTELAEAFYSTR